MAEDILHIVHRMGRETVEEQQSVTSCASASSNGQEIASESVTELKMQM